MSSHDLEIRHSNSPEEIRALADRGFEPIECSIGGRSIVGPLVMDHHGELSHMEGVALRAFRDHMGARSSDPRFVVTGRPDADATFAIAALAGRLPHEPALHGLAELIDRQDTAPIGMDLTREKWGRHLLVFNSLVTGAHLGAELFVFGVTLWSRIAQGLPESFLDAAATEERNRRDRAREAHVLFDEGGVLAVRGAAWGFDVWYGYKGGDPLRAASWAHPVVLSFHGDVSSITIGCPNIEVATELFGEGGLKNIFPRLEPEGWGGRESIGGSPRGLVLDPSAAVAASRRVLSLRV